MIHTIFIMPNKETESDATLMIVVDEKDPSTDPKTYQYVYVGNINDLPSDVLTEGSIVNDLTTGGTDKPLSAEQGRTLNSHVNYTTCESSAADQVKLISDDGFELSTNLRLLVLMTNTNTNSTPKFNINNTGIKDVWYNGVVASDTNTWGAGEVLDVYYDGTKYIATPYLNIDNEPTAGSDNLIKSGGVYPIIHSFQQSFAKTFVKELGNTVSIIGDSISSYQGTSPEGYWYYYPQGALNVRDVTDMWWSMILSELGVSLGVNASWNGSRVTDTADNPDFPDFYDRCGILGTPNTIFVALGTNDSTNNVTLGDYDYDSSIASLSESEFIPAYIKGIKTLQQNYPNANIYLFAFKMRDEYYNAIANIAAHYNLPLLRVADYEANTGNLSHPNNLGMKTIAQRFNKSMFYSKYVSGVRVGNDGFVTGKDIQNTINGIVPLDKISTEKGFIISTATGNWSSSPSAEYYIIPLSGTGTIKITKASDVATSVCLLSDYTFPINGENANRLAAVAPDTETAYDTTAKYLYILKYYNSDRMPLTINVNGVDIIKDVYWNIYKNIVEGNVMIPDDTISRFGLIYVNGIALQFDSTNKTVTIPTGSRIFVKNSYILGPSSETVLDLKKDYNNADIKYGGAICFDIDTNTFKCVANDNGVLNRKFIVLATYYGLGKNNIANKYISTPSVYTLDGYLYGIIKNSVLNGIKLKDTVDVTSIETLIPNYELIELQAPNPTDIYWWSDFIIININGVDEMWFFRASSGEDHTSANGNIYRVRMSDWTLIGTIMHDFGHCNTCHYDAVNDRLLIGNLPGSTDYLSALYIFYNVTSWASESTVRFANLDKTIINLEYFNTPNNTLTNVSACWAEGNYGKRNIVWIKGNVGSNKITKIILGEGTNEFTHGTYAAASEGKFNGTYNILVEPFEYQYIYSNSLEVDQGIDFVGGKILTTNGHGYILGFEWSYTLAGMDRKQIVLKTYTDAGIELYNTSEGICYKDGYIYQGCIPATNSEGTGRDTTRTPKIIKYKI